MYKISLLLLFINFFVTALHAQKLHTDTVINTGIYKSYFCYAIKEPLYVTYSLRKGGGTCSRAGMNFTQCGINSAAASDYSYSGFEEGHLANAEDFAFDCAKEAQTFCFYNCVPQTLKLNRGIWKTWESKIRGISQKQKLFIIAGSVYRKKKIGNNKIGVPDYCYKIVLTSSTKKIMFCLLFPNNNSNKVQSITLAALKKKLNYDLVP